MPVQLLGQPEPLGKVVGIGHIPELGRQQRVPPDLLPLFAGQRRAQPPLQLLQLVEYPVKFLPLRRRLAQGVVLPEKISRSLSDIFITSHLFYLYSR